MKKNFKFSPEFRTNFRGWNNASFGDEQGVEVPKQLPTQVGRFPLI